MQRGQTLAFTVSTYLRRKSIDKVNGKIRSHVSVDEIEDLKTVEINNISLKSLSNPFNGLDSLTEVQTLIRRLCKEKYFEKLGSIAVKASCGSGKTLAGIYMMRYFCCKTLIISTRNAVIDQWYNQLHTLYPELNIFTSESRKKDLDADVWILTPQYLNSKNRIESETFDIKPSLIIYDEIHTMLSETSKSHEQEFLNVLKYPFIRAQRHEWDQLPYMLALSATYPEKMDNLNRVFGEPFYKSSSISKTPIYIYDLRDETSKKKRGKCDKDYHPLDQYDCIEYFINNIPFYRGDLKLNDASKYEPINLSKQLKGLVMSYSIDSSVWAALYIHKILKADVLLVRTNDQKSYYFPHDQFIDFKYDKDIQYDDLKKNKIGIPCKYHEYIDDAEIVVSTTQRMKEGFSNECLVWGITSLFPYSQLTRVQIAGRIRRSSRNIEINKAKRIMYVNSGTVPSTMFIGGKFNSNAEETYSWEFENKLFKEENINYISKHTE